MLLLVYFRITMLIEYGLVEKWRKVYYPINKCQTNVQDFAKEPATLENVQGAFVLLLIGIVFSVFAIIIEIRVYKLVNYIMHDITL